MLNGSLLLIYDVVGHPRQMTLFSVPDSMIMQLCLELPGKKKKRKKRGNWECSQLKDPLGNEKLSLQSTGPASKTLNTTEKPMDLPLAYHW